jgi:hypothetical protein
MTNPEGAECKSKSESSSKNAHSTRISRNPGTEYVWVALKADGRNLVRVLVVLVSCLGLVWVLAPEQINQKQGVVKAS